MLRLVRTLLVPAALVLSLAHAVPGVNAQSGQTPSVEQKKQTEILNEQKLASLMSAVGVLVDPKNRVTTSQTYQALRLDLTTSATSPANRNSLAQTFVTSIDSSERRPGQLPRHRSIELSSQHLVLVTVDSANRLRWWSQISDPRILRAEEPDASNRLSGRVIFQSSVEASVEIPDDPSATELRFYHPKWTDDRFVLTLVSSVGLNKN